MKLFILAASLLVLLGCQSMPEGIKDDTQAAQKAKERAAEAYRDLSKEM